MTVRARTVGVVGAGHVGGAVASALALLRIADRVVLWDRTRALAEAEAWDIDDATPLFGDVEIVPTDDLGDLRDADVLVLAIGVSVPAGGTRLDIRGNVPIVQELMGELDAVAPEAMVLIVSNPVDVLTRIALEASSRPAHKIAGAGTVLDTARLRRQVSRLLATDVRNTHIDVLGEHGDSSFALWSGAHIGPVPLDRFPLPPGTTLDELRTRATEGTHRRGPQVHAGKGYTDRAIAAVVCRIADSILHDTGRVLSLSVPALPGYGIGTDVVLGLPAIVGRAGVERRLEVPRDATEQELLERSATTLERAYAACLAAG